jgi:hypothetical protein
MVTRLCIDCAVTFVAFLVARKIFFCEQRESRFIFIRWNPAQRNDLLSFFSAQDVAHDHRG